MAVETESSALCINPKCEQRCIELSLLDLSFILTTVVHVRFYLFADDQSERDADILRGEVSLQRYVKSLSCLYDVATFMQLPHQLQVFRFAAWGIYDVILQTFFRQRNKFTPASSSKRVLLT